MDAPTWMGAAAAAVFVSARGEVGGEWTPDRLADLEQYAVKRALWLEAEDSLARDGAVVVLRNDKGEFKAMQANPYVKIAEDARKSMAQLWARLLSCFVPDGAAPTTRQVRAIAEAVSLALPAPDVAAAAGVSVMQLRAWLDRGEDGDADFVPLLSAVSAAAAARGGHG